MMVSDTFVRLRAKYMQKPGLALIGPQPILRKVFELESRLTQKPFKGVKISEATIGGVPGLKFLPKGVAEDAPKLLYYHGGGFTIGSPRTHKWMIARIAAGAGVQAFAPDYRKAPEHPYPAAQEDALAVAREYTPDAVAGDSAGGNLSLYVSTQISLKAMALLSPFADQTRLHSADFSNEHLIPRAWVIRIKRVLKADAHNPMASPLLGDLSSAPPSLIQVGSQEVLRHDAEHLAKVMPDAKLSIYDRMPHDWQLHAGLNATADCAVAEIADFLKARL